MKIIFINGAPRSGKDSAGHYIWFNMPGTDNYIYKFADEVKTRCHKAHYCKEDPNIFEKCKDISSNHFRGKTPREAYMQFSEGFMKPLYGKDVFGKILKSRLSVDEEEFAAKTAIITDSGFKEEAMPIIEHFGAENCILLRLHRPGFGFENDSRSLIDLHEEGVSCYDIPSPDGDLEGMYKELRSRVPFLFRE